MWILAVDSATPRLGVALAQLDTQGALTACHLASGDEGRGQHARRLPGLFIEVLARTKLSLRDLGALVVGLGPGSFTGLRTGLSTMKALAYGRNLPLFGESSLAGLALDALRALPERQDDLRLLPCFDARRAEVYASAHDAKGQAIDPLPLATAISPADLLLGLSGRSPGCTIVFGPGAAAYPLLAGSPFHRPDLPAYPTGRGLLEQALPRLLCGDPDDPLTLVPRYARKSEAERQIEAGSLKFR